MSEQTIYNPLQIDEERYPESTVNSVEFFQCQCHSNEHTVKFSIDEEDGTIYTSIFLNTFYPWYYRIWIAIKYIFGYKSRFGHWDCFLLKQEDHPRLLRLMSKSNEIHASKIACSLEQTQKTLQTSSIPPNNF